MNEVNLAAPWYTYQKKLAAIFELDEDVSVGALTGEDSSMQIEIGVKNHAKAAALTKLLRSSVQFGAVNLTVHVTDLSGENDIVEAAKTAFAYNRRVYTVETVKGTGFERTYVVFDPEVIQFFNDNLGDYRGNFNALAEDVARDIFVGDTSLSYCTADLYEND